MLGPSVDHRRCRSMGFDGGLRLSVLATPAAPRSAEMAIWSMKFKTYKDDMVREKRPNSGGQF